MLRLLSCSGRRATPRVLAAAVVAFTFALAGSAVRAEIVNWDQSFLLLGGGGFENPLLRLAFNPQPEPPARLTELDLTHPPEPGLVLRGFSNPQTFRLFFAVGLPAVQLVMGPVALPRGNVATLGMEVFEMTAAGGPGAKMFDVFFDFMTSSGGVADGLSMVSFNPQPEPPAVGAGAALFGMDFSFTSLSDATVTLRMFDAAGNQLTFAAAPEPASLALLAGGLVVLGWRRRRAQSDPRVAPQPLGLSSAT